jgi:TetR/AcrR family transcriptional repressor of nem operon
MAEKLSHKDRTRARILDAAALAMQAGGTERTGVAEVMQRAGLTHGGFYAHFGSRDELLAKAVDRMLMHSEAMIHEKHDESDAVASLNKLFDYYLSEDVRKISGHVCPLPGLAGEASRMPKAARDRFNKGVLDFRKAISSVLTALVDAEPENLAISILSEMVGAMALARAAASDKAGNEILQASRDALKKRVGSRVAETAFHGNKSV